MYMLVHDTSQFVWSRRSSRCKQGIMRLEGIRNGNGAMWTLSRLVRPADDYPAHEAGFQEGGYWFKCRPLAGGDDTTTCVREKILHQIYY